MAKEFEVPGGDMEPTRAEKRAVEQMSESTARAALNLRIAGAEYIEIARVLDYVSPRSARLAVERILASAYDAETDYKSLRQLESARLEALMKSLSKKAFDASSPDHLAYNRQFASVLDRHIRLHGLDAPQVIAHINPAAEQFDMVVRALTDRELSKAPQEADIMLTESEDDVWEEGDRDDEASGDEEEDRDE